MALRPPKDFSPPAAPPHPPGEAELRALWERRERARRDRDRSGEWRAVLEEARRDPGGELHPASAARELPAYLRKRLALGPHARQALRPVPAQGRVLAAGIDTLSPCWYAEPGSPLARSMRALATHQVGRAWLLPDPIGGYRVGWFEQPGLVFAEGRPGGEALCAAVELSGALRRLRGDLGDLGIPLAAGIDAGLRRLDLAADLYADSATEGLALLECLGAVSLGTGKIVAYRAERCIESVLIKSSAGRTLARVYDRGAHSGVLPRGRWLRFEAQWRLPREARIDPAEIDPPLLRERFKRRFEAVWQAAGGIRVGGVATVGERVGEAVRRGQLLPSRARSIAGYLVLGASGVPQGATRTVHELERECRQLGLTVSLLQAPERRVDVAAVLDECLAPEVWG